MNREPLTPAITTFEVESQDPVLGASAITLDANADTVASQARYCSAVLKNKTMAKQDATVADSISRLCLAALVALINENNALFKAASEKQALQMLDHLVLTKRDHLKNIVKPIVEDILQELIGGQHQDGEIYQAHASRAAHPPNRPTIWASDKENIVKNNNATQQFNSMEDLSAVEDERQRMRQRSRSDKESDERLRERQLPIPSSDKGLEASLDREEM